MNKKQMHQKDLFHAHMVKGATFQGFMDIPKLKPCFMVPKKLIPFSCAISNHFDNHDAFVHFYEDDFRFERIWNNPARYAEILSRYAGVITPDFSSCIDFPVALQIWNTYRDRACGHYWQRHFGMNTIPNIRASTSKQPWRIDGIPKHALIAISSRACLKDRDNRELLIQNVKYACENLQPSGIIWHGSEAFGITDYPKELGIPIYSYPVSGRGGLVGGQREGQ